jgi:hypothetical protein
VKAAGAVLYSLSHTHILSFGEGWSRGGNRGLGGVPLGTAAIFEPPVAGGVEFAPIGFTELRGVRSVQGHTGISCCLRPHHSIGKKLFDGGFVDGGCVFGVHGFDVGFGNRFGVCRCEGGDLWIFRIKLFRDAEFGRETVTVHSAPASPSPLHGMRCLVQEACGRGSLFRNALKQGGPMSAQAASSKSGEPKTPVTTFAGTTESSAEDFLVRRRRGVQPAFSK